MHVSPADKATILCVTAESLTTLRGGLLAAIGIGLGGALLFVSSLRAGSAKLSEQLGPSFAFGALGVLATLVVGMQFMSKLSDFKAGIQKPQQLLTGAVDLPAVSGHFDLGVEDAVVLHAGQPLTFVNIHQGDATPFDLLQVLRSHAKKQGQLAGHSRLTLSGSEQSAAPSPPPKDPDTQSLEELQASMKSHNGRMSLAVFADRNVHFDELMRVLAPSIDLDVFNFYLVHRDEDDSPKGGPNREERLKTALGSLAFLMPPSLFSAKVRIHSRIEPAPSLSAEEAARFHIALAGLKAAFPGQKNESGPEDELALLEDGDGLRLLRQGSSTHLTATDFKSLRSELTRSLGAKTEQELDELLKNELVYVVPKAGDDLQRVLELVELFPDVEKVLTSDRDGVLAKMNAVGSANGAAPATPTP